MGRQQPLRQVAQTTAWPADKVERRDVAALVPAARNARTHSAEQVRQIAESITEWGWTTPVLLDEQGEIIAGHGRVLAAKLLKLKTVPVMVAQGWTKAQIKAYRIADNQLALNAGWDDAMLRLEVSELAGLNFDIGLMGFSAEQATFLTGDGETPESADDKARGALLSRMAITIADPRHEAILGDHYLLGGVHHLIVAGVMRDWPEWSDLLTQGAIFCPYPGPFTPFGTIPEAHVLVMVQPDAYVAGHILDRYEDAFGEGAIAKVSSRE